MSRPTEEELVLLVNFRDAIADVQLTLEQRLDSYLITWLRARDLNVQRASEMLRKSLRWRKEKNIDSVLTWEAPNWFSTSYAYDIIGPSKDGCPVIVMPFGKWNVKIATESGKKEEFLRWFDQMFARCFAIMKQTNFKLGPDVYPVTQFICIVDYRCFSMKQLASFSGIQANVETVARFEANYPETLKAVYYINTPRIFSISWAMLKPTFATRTLEKFQIYDSDESKWIPALQKEIDADKLPTVFGGTNRNICEFLKINHIYHRDGVDNIDEYDGELVTTVISAGQELKLEYDITVLNTVIEWTFQTAAYDIGFALTYTNTDDDMVMMSENIFPYKRYDVNTIATKQEGSLKCTMKGTYTLVFDNKYSKFHDKTLHYMVTISDP